MKRAALPAAVTATAALLLSLASPASASGSIARTFNAYDLTNGTYDYNSLRTAAYVKSFPRPTVSSYYDSTITAVTSPYTRSESVNLYHAYNGAGSLNGSPIWTSTSEVAYILCWTTATSGGTNIDKVAAKLTVNDTFGWFIFYIPDQYIHDYVMESGHHC